VRQGGGEEVCVWGGVPFIEGARGGGSVGGGCGAWQSVGILIMTGREVNVLAGTA
jgi:hypothetical protein